MSNLTVPYYSEARLIVTTLWHLSDGFSLHLTNKNARNVRQRGRVIFDGKSYMTIDNPASPSSRIFIGRFKRKPPKLLIKKMSQSYKKPFKTFVTWPQ